MAVITYKCPNCGAEIKFDPKLQKGKCDFCLSEFTVDEIERLNGLDSQHINKENLEKFLDCRCLLVSRIGDGAAALAESYGMDTKDAAGMALISHLISLITIPLVLMLFQYLCF